MLKICIVLGLVPVALGVVCGLVVFIAAMIINFIIGLVLWPFENLWSMFIGLMAMLWIRNFVKSENYDPSEPLKYDLESDEISSDQLALFDKEYEEGRDIND